MTLIVDVESRGRDVVAPPPLEDLVLAVAFGRLFLVESLQGPVVTLIESPVTLDGDPVQPHLFERDVGRVDCPQLEGGVDDVEIESGLLEQASRRARLFYPLIGEPHIRPSGESVLQVPGALAVT